MLLTSQPVYTALSASTFPFSVKIIDSAFAPRVGTSIAATPVTNPH